MASCSTNACEDNNVYNFLEDDFDNIHEILNDESLEDEVMDDICENVSNLFSLFLL